MERKKELLRGRVINQEKGGYIVLRDGKEYPAEVSGKFRYETRTISDFPAVGDYIMGDFSEENSQVIIYEVLPRKSRFVRKAAGTSRLEQIVASNIDTVFICMSLNKDFNLRRLERYLSVAWDSGAIPVVVLTKSDLCIDIGKKIAAVKEVTEFVDVVVTSSLETDGYEAVLPYVGKDQTVAFIGSSGVGKSTLINRLLGEDYFETNGLRNDDKGRHTTTHRELIILPNGGMVIDTPGMREIGMWDA